MELIPTQRKALKLFRDPTRHILLQGGSRSGKTSFCVYVCLYIALNYPHVRILIARKYLSDVKGSIIYDTLPKVARLLNPSLEVYLVQNLNKQDHFVNFPNGSSIWFDGLSDERRSEKILGREYGIIFLSEATQIEYNAFQKLLTRLAQNIKGLTNRFLGDCNPTSKSHWLFKLFGENIDPIDKSPKNGKNYAWLRMNPIDNPHLSSEYIESLGDLSSRQRKRFLDGEWLEDIEGALWKQENIDRNRLTAGSVKDFERVVIGVDPAVKKNECANETGIVVVGLRDQKGYVIEDRSGVYSPNQWGKKVVDLYDFYQADMIVGEVNNGGDLVESNITHISKRVRVKKVHATRGKAKRAEPIVGIYERDEIKHLGLFDKLETQMTTWTEESTESPDRMDAMVWAFHELMSPYKKPKIYKL